MSECATLCDPRERLHQRLALGIGSRLNRIKADFVVIMGGDEFLGGGDGARVTNVAAVEGRDPIGEDDDGCVARALFQHQLDVAQQGGEVCALAE